MDEMTNQSPVTEDDSFELEEVNESPDEETVEEPASEETEPTQETDDNFLQIRYNGQDQFLTREQATTLAQKGMNYDKISQKLQEALDNPALKVIESNARKANMSVSDYVNRMAQFQDTLNIQQIANDFKAQNPDVSDAVAKQYANEVYKNQLAQMAKEQADREAQASQAEQDALVKEVKAFQSRFPDVDIQNLPNEVVDDINDGTPLMEAWLSYENRQLRNRLTNSNTNAKNKAQAVGNVAENTSASAGTDPFLQGLLD